MAENLDKSKQIITQWSEPSGTSGDYDTYRFSRPDGFRDPATEFVRITRKRPRRNWINIVLFIVTAITTTVAGAFMTGNEFEFSLRYFATGFSFSVPLLLILGVHEMGHYLASRYHGVDASLPFFIPGPSFIGTFGALIKIRSPITNKRALFDIGFSGPAAGFALAVPMLFIGMAKSTVVDMATVADGSIMFGESLLTLLAGTILYGDLPDTAGLYYHPMAFAAWIGLWVTSINLLPLGQLDGGHIAYAWFGQKWSKFSKIILGAMVILGFFWLGWLFWALMILLVIKLRHPKTLDEGYPLTGMRAKLAWLALIIFVLTFIPVPFRF